MTEADHLVVFYRKTAKLQDKLRRSEEERLKLEEKFAAMARACREEEEARFLAVQDSYEKFLKEDRKRRERNERILQTLDRIENHAAMMSAKTDRLKLLTQHYEAYLSRVYPEWKLRDKTLGRKIPVHTGQFKSCYMPQRYPHSQSTLANSVVEYPSAPQIDQYRHPNTGRDSMAVDRNPAIKSSISVTNGSKLSFPRLFNNISPINSNIIPSKQLDVITTEQNYARKPRLHYNTHTLDFRNEHLESSAEKSLGGVGSGVCKHSEDSRLGSIFDQEMEQNTSRDLLNESLSDDGVVQDEICPSASVQNAGSGDGAISTVPLGRGGLGASKKILSDPARVNLPTHNRIYTIDKQITEIEEPENLKAALKSSQSSVKGNVNKINTTGLLSLSSNQGEVDESLDVSGHGLNGTLGEPIIEVNGSKPFKMMHNEKLSVNKTNIKMNLDHGNGNVGGKYPAFPCESTKTSETANVELVHRKPELAQKQEFSELPTFSPIFQKESGGNEDKHVKDHPARHMGTINEAPQRVVSLLEVSDNNEGKQEEFSKQILKHSNNGQYEVEKKISKEDSNKMNEELILQSNQNSKQKIDQYETESLVNKAESYGKSDLEKPCTEDPGMNHAVGNGRKYSETQVYQNTVKTGSEQEKCQNDGDGEYVVNGRGQHNIFNEGESTVDNTGQHKKAGQGDQYNMNVVEQYQKVDEDGHLILNEAEQYQTISKDGQHAVDESGQYQTVAENEQYIVDEAGQYQTVGEDGQYIVDETGQYQTVGENGQYIVDEAGQYQTVGENGQYIVDEAGQYQTVGEDGQYTVDEAGHYQTSGDDGQYIFDESGQYRTVGENGQYIVDEAGQYQTVDEDGQYIVDEAGQYKTVGEDGQYIVDEAGQYQTVGEGGQYIVNEAGQYQTVGEDGQYVGGAGQYQTVGEDGQYIVGESEQYQAVGEDRQYIVDEAGQYQTVGEDGQYIVDEAGQYQTVGENGQYIVDEAGQYQTVDENSHVNEAEQYQTVGEDGQYIVDESGQYQAVDKDGQYIVDGAGQYQTIGEDGQYIVDETDQYKTIGDGGQSIVDTPGEYESDDAKKHLRQYNKNDVVGDHYRDAAEKNIDGDQCSANASQPQKSDELDKNAVNNRGQNIVINQQVLSFETDKGPHQHDRDQHRAENQWNTEESSNLAAVDRIGYFEQNREEKGAVVCEADHPPGLRSEVKTVHPQDELGNFGNATGSVRNKDASELQSSSLQGRETMEQCDGPKGQPTSYSHGVDNQMNIANRSAEQTAQASSANRGLEGNALAKEGQQTGTDEKQLSREAMNQRMRDVLGGVGQESSDESSDVPVPQRPLVQVPPVPTTHASPSATLPVKSPSSRTVASKKLPGLTKMMESDSESLQLDANPTTSNDESDDFDFSSEK